MNINPELLILARESRGLTQKELSNRLDIGQGTLSKIEQGLQGASDEILGKLSRILKYPDSFYKLRCNVYNPNLIYFRKRISISKKILSKAEANMNIIRIALEKMLNNIDLPQPEIIDWDVEENGPPEKAAIYIRNVWKISKGRIENLFGLLENKGIFILPFNFENKKFDAMSMITDSNHPIIFVNSEMPGDRQRLSVSHELGHLIMHFKSVPSLERDIESEAFSFAGELLVPGNEYCQRFEKIDLTTLANQKRYWKVSMGSLIFRAKDLKLISENQARYLWAQMASLGYKTSEPPELDVEKEEATLVKEIIQVHINELDYDMKDLLSMTHLFEPDFNEFFLSSRNSRLRVVH